MIESAPTEMSTNIFDIKQWTEKQTNRHRYLWAQSDTGSWANILSINVSRNIKQAATNKRKHI